jgi:hypothetical protein
MIARLENSVKAAPSYVEFITTIQAGGFIGGKFH